MKVSVDLSLIPIGVGVSLSPSIATAIRVLKSHGFQPVTHGHGTAIEGEYDAVFAALRAAIEAVHADGAPRVSTSIKLSSRTDREQSDADRVASVERRLKS